MATEFFKEEDIEEFRECFYLYARRREVTTADELATIMRSLRLSPTSDELKVYLKQAGGKLTFAQFLEVMAKHTRKEKVPEDIETAFKERDPRGTGQAAVSELRRLLLRWGDPLSRSEVEKVFREANVPSGGQFNYRDFLKIVCAPLPDYN